MNSWVYSREYDLVLRRFRAFVRGELGGGYRRVTDPDRPLLPPPSETARRLSKLGVSGCASDYSQPPVPKGFAITVAEDLSDWRSK